MNADDKALKQERLKRLLGFIEIDPNNAQLLSDAASTAFELGRFEQTDALLARIEERTALSPQLSHLSGLSALSQGRFEQAEACFARLAGEHGDATLRFNLAYAVAMQERYADASALLTDAVLDGVPAAVRLKMQCLYHLGDLPAVIALGERHVDHPEIGAQVCGLLATAAFDDDDFERAAHYAAGAPDSVGGLTVQGLISLHGDDQELALLRFEQALEADPGSGRAQLGEGLALLARHDFAQAAPRLDRAAKLLRRHAGSWLSAGWAYLLAGDHASARERFQRSLDSDRGFAEATGALAVVDVLEGRIDDAEHRTEAAMRLDPDCLSAAYARSLLLNRNGREQDGAAAFQALTRRPLTAGGPSIAQLVARRAAPGRRH